MSEVKMGRAHRAWKEEKKKHRTCWEKGRGKWISPPLRGRKDKGRGDFFQTTKHKRRWSVLSVSKKKKRERRRALRKRGRPNTCGAKGRKGKEQCEKGVGGGKPRNLVAGEEEEESKLATRRRKRGEGENVFSIYKKPKVSEGKKGGKGDAPNRKICSPNLLEEGGRTQLQPLARPKSIASRKRNIVRPRKKIGEASGEGEKKGKACRSRARGVKGNRHPFIKVKVGWHRVQWRRAFITRGKPPDRKRRFAEGGERKSQLT